MTGRRPWRGGIIAAGDGRRLREGGLSGSKAMTLVGGRPLIEHALDRFRAAGIDRVCVLINEASQDCRDWLERRGEPDVVVRTTPSSFASFNLVAERLAGSPAIITTVDGVMPVEDFAAFVASAETLGPDAVGLGLTTHVDDEAPLWAELDPADGRIVRLGGEPAAHVTAGLYVLPAHPPALAGRFDRLRDYLARLVIEGFPVHGLVLPVVFDVDRPSDIVQAERALVTQFGLEAAR